MTEYLKRSEWTSEARGGADLTAAKLRGVAIHWPGDTSPASFATLSRAGIVRKLQAYRRYHVSIKGWSDIGYQVAIDPAGRVWDLRGIDRVPAAHASPKNPDANQEFGAVLFLVGLNEAPTKRQVDAFNAWASDVWLKRWPKADELTVHRRVPGAETVCPGARIVNLVDTRRLVIRPRPTKPKPKPAAAQDAGELGRYVVRRGDTLGELAKRFGTSVATLAKLNRIKHPDIIYVGQRLRVPVRTYTIRRGDTLSEIAHRFGTSVATLAKLNKIKDPDHIEAGDKIKLR